MTSDYQCDSADVLDFSMKKRKLHSLRVEEYSTDSFESSTADLVTSSTTFQSSTVTAGQTSVLNAINRTSPSSMEGFPSKFALSLLAKRTLLTEVMGSLTPTTSLALAALHKRRRRSLNDHNKHGNVREQESMLEKDEVYWDKRRKNNQAAKRSRDARKLKESEIALRATVLEQENCRLKAEVSVLKSEMSRLHCLLFRQK